MQTVTLPRSEYQQLKRRAEAFERILSIMEGNLFSPPPIRSSKKIISEFRKTGKYSKDFLDSLERGLQRSSYFEK